MHERKQMAIYIAPYKNRMKVLHSSACYST